MSEANSTFSLYTRTEFLRRELYRLVEQYGLNHPRVIQKSIELDKLILELQRRRSVMNTGTVGQVDSVRAVRRKSCRLSLVEKLSGKSEQFIDRMQEWLESKDSLPAVVVGYGIIILTGIYLVSQILKCAIRLAG
ncbi:aspartyl-phosphate phosphatase Spo0E family protein [Desulfolucanica intricata]|uniref:aspartyl-phosphate phosphatase Spo0E family protein n=1 Tax=Desulfolucanica intricata TaxID=1285191 RepID=UPI0008367845|nr:aspartyl-phosphate phosphatase Spo0E family protein [Desulfolucanica intricata]